MSSGPGSRRGFSVLELLMTVVVVGIALVPLILSLKTSTRTVAGTRDYLGAVAFAQMALEEIRTTAFRKPTQATASATLPTLDDCVRDLNARKKNLSENGVMYERTVTLHPNGVANLPPGRPDLLVVQIAVHWKPPGSGFLSASQEYQLFSLVGSATQP